MAVRSFAISTSYVSPRRWVRVRLHPDVPALRAAAHALQPYPEGLAHWGQCYGCFHSTSYRQNEETGAIRYPRNGYSGLLRLVEPDALMDDEGNSLPFTEIVAHELVHAAAAVYRIAVAHTINLGAGRGKSFQHEEDFAYIYSDLAADMWTKIA